MERKEFEVELSNGERKGNDRSQPIRLEVKMTDESNLWRGRQERRIMAVEIEYWRRADEVVVVKGAGDEGWCSHGGVGGVDEG